MQYGPQYPKIMPYICINNQTVFPQKCTKVEMCVCTLSISKRNVIIFILNEETVSVFCRIESYCFFLVFFSPSMGKDRGYSSNE